MTIRIIGRLDIKGDNLVKGIHLEGLRVLGKPESYADLYYSEGIDELICMDVVASLFGRNSLTDVVQRIANNVFVPLCVGGGLRTLEDIRVALRAGADKVAINTAAINRPEFVREAVEAFGSSAIVVAIEAIQQPDKRFTCFTDCGRQESGVEALAWAEQVSELGAGEILLTSVEREGTGGGLATEFCRQIADAVPIPVILHGGAGHVDHVVDAITEGHADAVCLASLLHYNAVRRLDIDVDELGDDGNFEFLLHYRDRGFSKVSDATVGSVKAALKAANLEVRL